MPYKEGEKNEKDLFLFEEDWMLPDWLQEKKEMVFPQHTIVKGECLGRGQFGTVFKGKLVQGNSEYAIRYIYRHYIFLYL